MNIIFRSTAILSTIVIAFASPCRATRSAEPAKVLPAISIKPDEVDGKSFDLVVVGGTPGGIACAVRAAREGLQVLLVNHTAHLGGFMTSGAGGWEAPYDGIRSPLYGEIRLGAAEYYRQTYGQDSPQHKASLPDPTSNAHIDRPKIEPRIAELLFNRMVEREKNLRVLTRFYVSAVERDGAILQSITLQEMRGKANCKVSAKVFADGMYEADLAAAAKVPYRVGREARTEYDEQHAGVIYTKERHKAKGQRGFPKAADDGQLKIRYNSHATAERVEGKGSGEADASVMAYNFRLILTKVPTNRLMIEKPANYDSKIAKAALGGGFVPNLPNDKVAWNGGRLIGPQNGYPEADWPTREKISRQYLDAMLMLLWYYQHDPAATKAEQTMWKDYGLARDEFVDNNHLPYEIYVREARRLVGRYVFREQDNVVAAGIARTPIHADSIAMTDWPVDSVACLPRKAPGGNTDGIFFLGEETRPAQVPYRTLLPQGVDNLLVPVALSASHVGWGAIRLEPCWMQTGESAGFAAALAVKGTKTPAQLDSDLLVKTLIANRVVVSFFNDIDPSSENNWHPGIEYFGTQGFFASYDAKPEKPLTISVAKLWANAAGALAARKTSDPNDLARAVAKAEAEDQPAISAEQFKELLQNALKLQNPPALGANKTLSRAAACRWMYEILNKLNSP